MFGRWIAGSVCLLLVVFWSGCSMKPQPWEINVDNQSTTPCSVYVTLGFKSASSQQSSEAHIEGLGTKKLTLLTGDLPSQLQSLRIVRGEVEQELPVAGKTLQPGQKLQIVITADGKATVK